MGPGVFVLFVAPRVFRAPSGPAVGPGYLACPWAAARPRAVRAASFARRVVSKPGQAPPPPTGTAARPSGPSGALHTSVALRVVLRSGQASPPGPVDQVGRLSETVIAFACWYLCGSETCIAFAGAKWAYLVHFSGAVVMSVSAVPCWGRAVVLLVSTSPCCRALGAMFFSLLGLVCASAKKFALRGANNVETQKSSPSAGKMTTNWRFMARWASFFAEMPLEGRCWANFVADRQSWDPTGQVVLRRWCSGRRMARPLCVPVGGGPPASRPRRELRSARRLEARPGPATAHRHRGSSLQRPHTGGAWRAGVWTGVSSRSAARPAIAHGTARPSGPSGACTPAALGVQVRSVGRPRPRR